uniref:Uncharacterized protein n=1 Tax=Candidatus Kentrum sp. UNK TaxID=2126344 RepID=A0A451AX57_9GAMM|nr:MAG: hypothetical protein BECKUNK1418G_GA0071005_10267 [Candidatus Kentron sp. UNK]VFK70562.1 MAG: hypothetical protein BECKUNK1418H_GA0071006_10327 [Candidatus Kentron sp. UNK]
MEKNSLQHENTTGGTDHLGKQLLARLQIRLNKMDTEIALACIGGFSVNLLQLMEYSKLPKPERPDFKDLLFWLPYLVWPVLSGVLAFAYIESGISLSPLLTLNIGLSAPLIFRAMLEANPMKPNSIDPGDGA